VFWTVAVEFWPVTSYSNKKWVLWGINTGQVCTWQICLLGKGTELTNELTWIANAIAVAPQLAHPALDGVLRSRSYVGK
jgi:hypothetical protein